MRVERSARSIVQKAVITRANSYRIGVAEMVAVISLCLVIRVEAEITSVWCTCSKQPAGGLFSGGGVGRSWYVVSRYRFGLGYDSSLTKYSIKIARKK